MDLNEIALQLEKQIKQEMAQALSEKAPELDGRYVLKEKNEDPN